MERKERNLSKIDDDIKSAGQSFIGLYMSDMLGRIPELDDKVKKVKLIEEYHSRQYGFFDKDIGGTRTRVNAVVRIIRADKVLYALGKVDGSDPRVVPEAVAKAKETIGKIKNGKLILQILNK